MSSTDEVVTTSPLSIKAKISASLASSSMHPASLSSLFFKLYSPEDLLWTYQIKYIQRRTGTLYKQELTYISNHNFLPANTGFSQPLILQVSWSTVPMLHRTCIKFSGLDLLKIPLIVLFIYLLTYFRNRGWKRNINVREKYHSGAWNAPQPGMCPDPESNRWPSVYRMMHQPNEPHWPGYHCV